MPVNNTSIVLCGLGVIFGFFLGNLFFANKKRDQALRQFLFVGGAVLTNQLISYIDPEKVIIPTLFSIGSLMGIVLVILYYFLSIYLNYKRRLNVHTSMKYQLPLTFIDLINQGYHEFKRQQELTLRSADIDKLINRRDIYLFIAEINSVYYQPSQENVLAYFLYVQERFSLIFPECRFTFREYNALENTMITVQTSRQENTPGAIDLSRVNAISASLCLGRFILYSREPEFHQNTSNRSIEKGIYDDYVCRCLAHANGVPLYSLCIDVKGEAPQHKLIWLLDNGYFEQMAIAISSKIAILATANNAPILEYIVDQNNKGN